MPKTLKPYTIIPSHLYVHRDADKQIKHIIKDMERPGYVLVSRQMGKTNLLLNTKREFETNDDIYIYLDLSNPFETAKSCFENIINTILDVYIDRLPNIRELIDKQRINNSFPDHKLHTNELRHILKSIPGKLVIILDEIDALTKTEYSDRIFSQIRSIYFLRANFPEFSRLTYILSGVVEPTEIIKDPKISPFNIGQKIFLNDFSYDEFETFLFQANLQLGQDIQDHIYDWTSGNPRITWDVCSEIENLNKVKPISKDDVDKIIKNNYLKTYDKPPIDTIRDIVKKDIELRNSIIELEYKKGQTISDKIKSKLYLAGIINYDDEGIKIKNKVIKNALNTEWINELEMEEKGLAKLASDLYEKKNYIKSLELFEKYLENNEFTDKKQSYYYQMGSAAFYLSEHQKSIRYFKKTELDKKDEPKLYYMVLNFIGLSSSYLNLYEKSLKCFKTVLERETKDDIFANALINYGVILLKINEDEYLSEAKKIFLGIIDETGIDSSKIEKVLLDELKTTSHYNLAKIADKESEKSFIVDNYNRALFFAIDEKKPVILLGLFSVLDDKSEIKKAISLIVELLCEKNLKPSESDTLNPLTFNLEHLVDILLIIYYEDKLSFNKILKENPYIIGDSSYSKYIFELAIISLNKNKSWKPAAIIFEDLVKNKSNPDYILDERSYYLSLKLFSFACNISENFNIILEYVDLFQKRYSLGIDVYDISIFSELGNHLSEANRRTEALTYLKVIDQYKTLIEKESQFDYLVIMNLQLNIYTFEKDKPNILNTAAEILSLISNNEQDISKNNLLSETGLEAIKKNAETLIKRHKKYGRNEFVKVKYKNGDILSKKFKRIERDIKSGACEIVY